MNNVPKSNINAAMGNLRSVIENIFKYTPLYLLKEHYVLILAYPNFNYSTTFLMLFVILFFSESPS